MKLNRSELGTILTWCAERNHCKLVIPEGLLERIRNAQGAFPYGKAMWYITEFWNTEVDFDITKEERDIIVHAIHENTAMEDARLPNNLLDRLRLM